MIVLGLNAYHGDSSACIVVDGKLIAAVEEERFTRIKHWAGFPTLAIQYCLEEASIKLSDVEHVAINSDPKAAFSKKLKYALVSRMDIGYIVDRIKNKQKRASVDEELQKVFPNEKVNCQVHHIEHHLCHLASSHFMSPFQKSVTVSVDGFGDFASAAWGLGDNNKIAIDGRVYFPHSMGIFYQAMTQYIGFPYYGDEYKVMGLAPYGKPVYMKQMREIVKTKSDGRFELNLEYFRHHKEKIEYEWKNGAPHVGDLFKPNKLEILFGFSRRNKEDELDQMHKDLAHSAQARYEEVFFNLLENLHSKYKVNQLTLSGGCAMNSVANGKVYRQSPFKEMYIQAAAGDAGGSIGAAFSVIANVNKNSTKYVMDHAYYGPEFSQEYIERLLDKNNDKLQKEKCTLHLFRSNDEVCERTAKAIADGLVVGWFQGRMEWGPRALGNRSILGDPRRSDMKEILNLKIKRRESFRPFAPSILREKVTEWFEEEDDVPFMMQVFQIKEDKRSKIPAVCHVDGSGRLQTVHANTNPRYHVLISKFYEITNVPIVLNTSFNENEPVVCKPEEALNTFLRTKMDVLVLGNYYIQRIE